MKKVLILGVTGMLGHKLYQTLRPVADVTGTARRSRRELIRYELFQDGSLLPDVDVTEPEKLAGAIEAANPDVVVNCVGVVKSLVETAGVAAAVNLNALFPHRLYQLCRERNAWLIHLSTDCVFSGKKGNYSEDDTPDPVDVYGSSKYLGEVHGAGVLVLRTSMIGRELDGAGGLLEWFIANRGGQVQGYSNAIFSGFPTLHLARIIAGIINDYENLNGLYHVAAGPIDKYRLLTLINTAMKLNISVEEYPDVRIDRSLDAARFREATGFTPLSWEQMIEEMAADAAPYDAWRQHGISG